MASQAFVKKVFRESTAVNMKTVAITTLIPAMSGLKLIPRAAWAYVVTRTGAGTGGAFKLGTNATTTATFSTLWANYSSGSSTTLGFAADVGLLFEITYNATSFLVPLDMTNGLKINVTTGSTFTTDTVMFFIEGILI